MNFDNLRILLVETSHPGNIGATARAMKTMGFEQLWLVRPLLFPHAEATARAAGAEDILVRTCVVDSLDSALTGCQLVIGTSARWRHLACPALDSRECAVRLNNFSEHLQVALVFGREKAGLTNEELERCHFLVHIPANPTYSSLNLAAAVQVLTYELRMAAAKSVTSETAIVGSLPAPAEEMRYFYAHLEQVLREISFLDPSNPRQLMRRLRRLFNRALPDQNEIKMLRGILTAVQARNNPSHP